MSICKAVSGRALLWVFGLLVVGTIAFLIACPSGIEIPTKGGHEFQLGDTLVVDADPADLEWFLGDVEKAKTDWGLVLQGRYLSKCPLCRGAVERTLDADGKPTTKIRFVLERTEADRDAWKALLEGDFPRTRDFSVGVASEDGRITLPLRGHSVRWKPWEWRAKTVFITLLIVLTLLASFCLVGRGLLRDPLPAGSTPMTRPLSLSRTQLFFWTLNAVVAFLFIWAVTGAMDTLTGSVLLLLGVSLGTKGIAGAIDTSKSVRHVALPKLKEDLETQTQALESAVEKKPGDAGLRASLQQVQTQLAQATVDLEDAPKAAAPAPADDWWTDLVSDGKAPAVHRLQHVLWTVALGAVFWGHVFRYLAMPDFDGTLLALAGLSSGGFLALKATEPTA